MLPSIVPPVFRSKAEPEAALLPPYSFNSGFLCNATEVPWPEVEALKAAGEITLFNEPIPAQSGYELWVDQSYDWHYEPRGHVDATLEQIATASIGEAEATMRAGNLSEAERFSGIAISADDRRVEPLAIKAAIRRLQHSASGEALMAELAAPVLEGRLFGLLVGDYCRSMQSPALESELVPSRRPMQRVATMRPAACCCTG
jgi:hypothetical protein